MLYDAAFVVEQWIPTLHRFLGSRMPSALCKKSSSGEVCFSNLLGNLKIHRNFKVFHQTEAMCGASRVNPARYLTPTHRSCHEIENFDVA